MSCRKTTLWAVLIFVALLAGCNQADDPVAGSGNATVRVLLTDAPSDYVAAAEVTISSVQLVPGDDETGFVELMDGEAPATYDLLQLQNGVNTLLAERSIPAGTYSQLRLRVQDATVSLIEGYEFNDGTTARSLTVPSGEQTGIKVETDGAIEAEEGMITVMVVDFDVNQSFVIQGDPETPAGINGMLFTPHLVEVERTAESM